MQYGTPFSASARLMTADNAVWNTVFGISQTYDGDKWYPSEVGSFNKIASSTECRFICATNYKWDADEEKCLPVSRVTNCSDKTPYSDWNVVSKISQTWDGENWIPSATSVYNTESSEEECRFVCKEHYEWQGGECKPVTTSGNVCKGLPANAQWVSPTTVEQTWNGTTWHPATTGIHATDGNAQECRFHCIAENDQYKWDNNSKLCVANTKTGQQCIGLKDHAHWNQYSAISQTWNGTEWFPPTAGTYSATADETRCYFTCDENYEWYGTACVGATKTANSTGLPDHAVYNTVSSITQTYNGTAYMPELTASYCDNASTEKCCFKCLENYTVSNDQKSCVPSTRQRDCTGLPDNAEWNTASSIEQHWDESASGFVPTLTPQYGTEATTAYCRYKCKENYEWKNSACQPATKTADCTGLPENAQWNSVATVLQEWKGAAWEPSSTGIFSEEESRSKCRFKCKENFTWDGNGTCVADTRFVECNARPDHSLWNYVSSVTQTWNGTEWFPKLEPEFDIAGSDNKCIFVCEENFYLLDNECVDHPCDYRPCRYVSNSTDVCEEKDDILLSYSCKCENGYLWQRSSGCHKEIRNPGNICTEAKRCFDSTTEITSPSKGEAFYGQDAQYAKMGFCTPHNFVVKTTEINESTTHQTVIDNNTGIEWQKVSGGNKNWENAKAYCAGLNNIDDTKVVYGGVYGGLSVCDPASSDYDPESPDCELWRLPTVKESMTIVDYEKYSPAYDTDYFDPKINGLSYTRMWSISDENPYVISEYGEISKSSSTSTQLPVRCVRGKALSENSFTTFIQNGDEIIKDLTTRRYWQANNFDERLEWEEALEYCENLNYGGYSDWRLPNINELFSAAIGSDLITGQIWSSTTYAKDNSYAFKTFQSVSETGRTFKTYIATKGGKDFVRCVRSDLCDDGYFWDGYSCVQSPCEEDSCSMEYSNGQCIPKTETSYSCGCVDGYFWNGSNCVSDPCLNHDCFSRENSDGTCYHSGGKTNFSCGCIDGYFWNGSRCRRINAFGNICTTQTKCYNNTAEIACPDEGEDFFGQDAQYKQTCRDAGLYEPLPDSEHSDQRVIIDRKTGLVWQKNNIQNYTFIQAATHCADLEYAGYTDWRLPKPKELFTVASRFSGTFWTSKKFGGNSAMSWIVTSAGGIEYKSADSSYKVVCVRGEPMAESSFTDIEMNGGVIVKDDFTGLMWQKSHFGGGKKNWQDSLKRCEDLEYAGYTDWRTPNNRELLSLVNFDEYNAASYFPMNRDPYVSSTTASDKAKVWAIDFTYGELKVYNKTYSPGFYVICVR